MTALAETAPYLALVLLGFLPNEIWRSLGVLVARGIDEDSEMFRWVRAVATAILAGVIGRILFFPPSALETVPLSLRTGAAFAGFAAFLLVRRSVLAGVLTGEAVLIGGVLLAGQLR